MGIFGDRSSSRIRKQNKVWLLMAEAGGQEVGMMTYRIEGQGKNLVSTSFYPGDSTGRYLLLEWLARHADQVKDVELKLPPFLQPETWLPDLNMCVAAAEPPMARVIDVCALGGMQTGSGRFAARITDPYCPWNDGVYAFESTEGALRVSPTASADCSLTIQGLTALVYGTHEPGDFSLRGWGEPSPAVQASMRAMFPPKLPYLHEVF
jgi:predicted acetyltransferase